MNNQPLITEDVLTAAGVNLEGKDLETFLTHLNDTLEERIGTEITNVLSDNKLKELIALQDQGDDETTGEWISENVPDLQQIAEDERDILLGELVDNADKI